MKIVWSKTAEKQFSKIDTRYQNRIKFRLEKMDDKTSPVADIKKLSSPENHYRLRLGDYRVIYTFGDPPGDICYPYESDIYDNVGLPGEVCDIMHSENVSLQAAWRILRGLSQQEVAEKLGISQSAVSQLEALDSRPQKRTREKLAAIYGCKQEQISLYLPKEG